MLRSKFPTIYVFMTEKEKLLRDIEAFIERADITATRFGVLSMNDRSLLPRLRAGSDVRTETARKLREFMRDWAPPKNPKHRAHARAA